MAQQLVQSQIGNIDLFFTSSGGFPVTGLIFSDLTCQFRKEGALSFSVKTLTALNFTEIGLGAYTIQFTASELNTLGSFITVVTGASIVQNSIISEVVTPASITPAVSIQTCVLTGYLLDLAGHPIQGAAVVARIVGNPTLLNNGGVGIGVGDNVLSTKSDNNGAFFLELARNVVVDIFISAIQYRRTLTVPNTATADLFAGIP